MPSVPHEALVALFRNRPVLAAELLRDALGVLLPAFAEARVEAADLSDLAPAEYRADLVVLLVDGKPVLAIVVEVQLHRDKRKTMTWPVYVTGLRARFECPACVLVVTPDERVAEWARVPIELGPGSQMVPWVLGPSAVPVIIDVAEALRDPELAILSIMAHGAGAYGGEVAYAAFEATKHLGEERRVLYSDLILASLSEAARARMEELMAAGKYEYQSDFAKTHQALGRAEGEALGRAEAVLGFLNARGLVVSEHDRARILACTDAETLDRWIRMAATITAAEALFE